MNDGTKSSIVEFLSDFWIVISISVVSLTVIGLMAYFMSIPNQTPRETFLETFILTTASIVVSAAATKAYAEISAGKSLRDHGVQIAGIIMQLKRQMEGLNDWVTQKRLTFIDSEKNDGTDFVLEHIEETLVGFQGMTESALSGIGGVIGDALAQYETVMQQISQMRLDALNKTNEIQQKIEQVDSTETVANLRTQIEEIEQKTLSEIAKLARSSVLPIPDLPTRRRIREACPYCSEMNSFDVIDRQGETKVVDCSRCKQRFSVHSLHGSQVLVRPFTTARIIAPPVLLSDKARRAKTFLVETSFWVPPSVLYKLIDGVLEKDKYITENGGERTPIALQNSILSDITLRQDADASNDAVRNFLKIAFTGGAFEFVSKSKSGFKSEYYNTLTKEKIIHSVILASVLSF